MIFLALAHRFQKRLGKTSKSRTNSILDFMTLEFLSRSIERDAHIAEEGIRKSRSSNQLELNLFPVDLRPRDSIDRRNFLSARSNFESLFNKFSPFSSSLSEKFMRHQIPPRQKIHEKFRREIIMRKKSRQQIEIFKKFFRCLEMKVESS